MKNYFKKMSLLLAVSSTIALTSSIGVFAADNYVTGVSNLNGTEENSAVVGSKLSQPEVGWIRFNQDNSNISYTGDWFNDGKTTSTWNMRDSAKFNFVGNKIRIVADKALYSGSNIEISIDGKVETFSEHGSGTGVMVFEKLNLDNVEHSVVITNKSYDGVDIDTIDINEGGQLKVYNESIYNHGVGQKSVVSEIGWMRFNDDDSNLYYSGGWFGYNNIKETANLGSNVKFNFVGNEIRIIAQKTPLSSSTIEISIDGKVEVFSEYSQSYEDKMIVFEKLDLDNVEHSVVITDKTYDSADIDAIDINAEGQLKPYVKVATTTPAAVQVTV